MIIYALILLVSRYDWKTKPRVNRTHAQLNLKLAVYLVLIRKRNIHNGRELGSDTLSPLNNIADTYESKTENKETKRAQGKTRQRITLSSNF